MVPTIRQTLFIYGLLISCISSFAQVGINTENPRTTLEVAGSAKTTALKVNTVLPLENGQNSTFLIQDSDGAIRTMDAQHPESTALGYLQVYELTNMDGDWIANFDTKIPAANYDVVAISAYFDQAVSSDDVRIGFSIPHTAAFVSDGTWRLKADYPGFSPGTGTNRKWTITIMIYSKTLSKNLGDKTYNIGSTGSGSTPNNDPVIE